MQVFISWSGPVSQKLGETIRRWLPSALHMVKPYFTPDDIEKGTRWGNEISKELDSSDFGVICLTHDNIERPWIMFEAGALAKKFQVAHVCPILFGLDNLPVQGPLSQFQAAKFTKKDFKRLFKTINSLCGEHKLDQDVLDDVFEMWWPRIESQVKDILENAESNNEVQEPPSQDEVLKELLELTRLNTDLTQRLARVSPSRGKIGPRYSFLSRDVFRIYRVCVDNEYEDAIPIVQLIARRVHKIIEANAPKLRKSLARLERITEEEKSSDGEESEE